MWLGLLSFTRCRDLKSGAHAYVASTEPLILGFLLIFPKIELRNGKIGSKVIQYVQAQTGALGVIFSLTIVMVTKGNRI